MPATYCARVVKPLPYAETSGRRATIPPGPCLVEEHGRQIVDIVWGACAEEAAVLPFEELEAAADRGDLVLLAQNLSEVDSRS